MNQYKRILVTVDTRQEHHPIVEEAVEIALKSGGSIKLMTVAPKLPWILRVTMDSSDEMQASVGSELGDRLDSIAASIRDRGIDVETVVASGKASVEIVMEVLRGNHDLVISPAKGKSSNRPGYYGKTALNLLRTCPCALWLVTHVDIPGFKNVLGCIDTSSDDSADADLNDKIFQQASQVSEFQDGQLSFIHCWNVWNEPLLKSRMEKDDFEELEKNLLNEETRLLDEFLKKHNSSVSDDNVYMFKGEVAETIASFVRRKEIDLVVLGTVGRTGLSGFITGNSAERIMGLIECSILALKPDDFVSSISLPETENAEGDVPSAEQT